jgi:hypothetical protein
MALEGGAGFPQEMKNQSAQIKNFITIPRGIGLASSQDFALCPRGRGEAVNIALTNRSSEKVLGGFYRLIVS